jgi:hypothetical protein
MEPTQDYLAPVAEAPPRSRSRVKVVLAGLAIAGLLTTWGAASVFAASPDPSASASGTTSSGTSDTTSGTGTHVCPADATANPSAAPT